MPGIAGIITQAGIKHHAPDLRLMVESLMHEPSYRSGTYINERFGVGTGWAVHPGSFSDCMPLWNKTNEVCLIFSGEHFGAQDNPARNGQHGRNGGAPDARSVLALYEDRGPSFLADLNGWFAGVLIDRKRSLAMLFNDRYGMHRLYYHESKDALYFASEAKALLRIHPGLRQLSLKGMGEVCSFGCVFENRTLFSGISLVPPGSVWTWQKGPINRKFYFTPEEWENQPALPKEDFYKQLRETFTGYLPHYLKTKNKIGISLTGGLDTRMILANVSVPEGTLPGYSFGGMYRECYDVKLGRTLASLCGQSHRVLEVNQRFLENFPALAEKTVFISDGNMDVTGAADLYVNQLAKEVAPVRITGNYGSEILRGSRHLKASSVLPGLFNPDFEQHITAAAGTLAAHYRGNRVSFAAFKQTPWYHYNRLVIEQSQLTMRSPFLDNRLVKLMYQAPTEVLDSSEISFRIINDGNRELGSIMTDMGLGGSKNRFLSALAKQYREFTFKADYACNYGQPQWMAKIESHVPAWLKMENFFLGRHKFHHFRIWFRDQLSGYVNEILLDRRSLNRPYLNSKGAEQIVRAHTSGRLNYTTEITKLLTAELLQRQLIDR